MNFQALLDRNRARSILEKFVIRKTSRNSKAGFFIRELCRHLDERINSVRRGTREPRRFGHPPFEGRKQEEIHYPDSIAPSSTRLPKFFEDVRSHFTHRIFQRSAKRVARVGFRRVERPLARPSNRIVDVLYSGNSTASSSTISWKRRFL